jgi:sterol desaturase/sphingolipid hydroxylase (fatty acid hydroxylase superfamily)
MLDLQLDCASAAEIGPMEIRWLIEGSAAFAAALVIGSLVEYVVHRLMHSRWFLGQKHAEHHKDGWGQGWAGEFWDYLLGGLVLLWWGFLYSIPVGVGWLSGLLVFAALAAYAHQLQHERPELCFWLKRPVHYLHHKHHMWRHNFGISMDIWDRLFGTYKVVDWAPEKRPFQYPLKSFFQIKWF